jgi:DNA-binding SARP family transcriptional activator/tetratricopeptide (TPR) repeat protein/energy-coupling factor transporter ATP-binding protein EcfA2
MRFAILGTLEVLGPDGRSVVPRGRMDRVILGALLLEPNEVVSRDRLIEVAWGDQPPETALNALQVHISRLRKLLGTTSERETALRARSPGYVLDVFEGELDATEFERLAAASGADEDHDAVANRLTDALRLWRGPVLDGLDIGMSSLPAVSRLDDLRLATIERRVEADLALGRHRDVTGELEGLVHDHPLRESLRGLLMVALYRSGRQADALAVFRHTRQLLAEELGIDPGPALQALELAVLDQSPQLDLPAAGDDRRRAPESAAAPSATRIPLPARLSTGPSVGMIGRLDELRILADAYKRVATDGGREVVLVSGEAGVGKSTLAAAAAGVAFDEGGLVLFGHSEEDLASPYQFFAETLDHFVKHASRGQLESHVRPYGSDLSHLVPSVLRLLPGLPATRATDADTERYLLFAAVVGMVADVSRSQPVVLVFDDVQWADRGSLMLLRHLAAAEQIPRVLIVATYRDSELMYADVLRDTLGALRRHSVVQRIDLGGLNDDEVVSYFEAASGHALDDKGFDLARSVYRETDGNPFFVGEVLRHLAEGGAIYRDDEGRWTVVDDLEDAALPDSVREVIGGRVARLGREAERVLSLAAVIGREFDLELLSHAAGISDDHVLDLLDGAVAAALVRDLQDRPGRFQFTHALIQHTLYQDLRTTRRAQAHRQVAQALEDLDMDASDARVGELARHWVAAIQPTDLAKAISYSRRAGDLALAALAPADALRFYSQALELSGHSEVPDPVLRLDVTIGLGTALRQAGDMTFRETLLGAGRAAAELGDTDRLVAAILANDRGTFSTVSTIDNEKVEMLEASLELLPADDVRRALVLATLCTELTVGSSLERREALADEALAIARTHGDDTTLVRVINHVLLPLAVPHLRDVSTARAVEGLALAESVGDPLLLCTAASGRRLIAGASGDMEEMDRCFELKGRLLAQIDFPFLNWVHTLQRATRALIAGDSSLGEEHALRALQLGNDGGQPDAAAAFGIQLIMVNLLRGTLGTLIPLIEQTVADNPGLPVFSAVLALAHAESDHEDDVRKLLEGFARTRFKLPLDVAWLTAMIAWAEAATACGEPRFAEPVLGLLAPFSNQWLYTDVTTAGPVSRPIGQLLTVLGRYDEAERAFEAAQVSCEGAHALFFGAQTNLAWGRMLAQRHAPGDTARARDLLAWARHAGATRGYKVVERRAAVELRLLDR